MEFVSVLGAAMEAVSRFGFFGRRRREDCPAPQINIAGDNYGNNYGNFFNDKGPSFTRELPTRVPVHPVHADVITGDGVAARGERELVAQLDRETNTFRISTTKGELALPLGKEPREFEPLLETMLDWLARNYLLVPITGEST